jgi:superfamily II DNA or RNA helicase
MKYQIDRTQRQIEGLKKWATFGYQGIAQYPTGFGKTYTAIKAILGMIRRGKVEDAIVVVPTIELKNQWEKELVDHKVSIAQVYVINTAVKLDITTDFLILDEVHRYAADTFKLVFEQIKYKYIMGLTATLEREDGLHDIVLKYLDIFDEISVNDALDNGWISPYEIYNIEIPFNPAEAADYKKSDNAFKHFAAKLGRGAQAFETAQQWIKSTDKAEQGIAAAYYNSMRSRKTICLNNSNKIPAIKTIMDLFPDKNSLLFSATTEFADSVQDVLGDTAMTFHSKLTKKQQELVIKKFKDKRTKVRTLSSVKALNEGFNVPDCSLAIIAGSNSTKRTFIQQLGRVVRFQEGKNAIIINLYTPDTQEEKWMMKRTEAINQNYVNAMTLQQFVTKFQNQLITV